MDTAVLRRRDPDGLIGRAVRGGRWRSPVATCCSAWSGQPTQPASSSPVRRAPAHRSHHVPSGSARCCRTTPACASPSSSKIVAAARHAPRSPVAWASPSRAIASWMRVPWRTRQLEAAFEPHRSRLAETQQRLTEAEVGVHSHRRLAAALGQLDGTVVPAQGVVVLTEAGRRQGEVAPRRGSEPVTRVLDTEGEAGVLHGRLVVAGEVAAHRHRVVHGHGQCRVVGSQGQHGGEVVHRRPVRSAPGLERPEVRVQHGEAETVGRRPQRPLVRCPPVGEVPTLFEERAQCGSELPAVVGERNGHQRGVLGLQPTQSGFDVVNVRQGRRPVLDRQLETAQLAVEAVRRRHRCGEVVVAQPPLGVVDPVGVADQAAGVPPQQVVISVTSHCPSVRADVRRAARRGSRGPWRRRDRSSPPPPAGRSPQPGGWRADGTSSRRQRTRARTTRRTPRRRRVRRR